MKPKTIKILLKMLTDLQEYFRNLAASHQDIGGFSSLSLDDFIAGTAKKSNFKKPVLSLLQAIADFELQETRPVATIQITLSLVQEPKLAKNPASEQSATASCEKAMLELITRLYHDLLHADRERLCNGYTPKKVSIEKEGPVLNYCFGVVAVLELEKDVSLEYDPDLWTNS